MVTICIWLILCINCTVRILSLIFLEPEVMWLNDFLVVFMAEFWIGVFYACHYFKRFELWSRRDILVVVKVVWGKSGWQKNYLIIHYFLWYIEKLLVEQNAFINYSPTITFFLSDVHSEKLDIKHKHLKIACPYSVPNVTHLKTPLIRTGNTPAKMSSIIL